MLGPLARPFLLAVVFCVCALAEAQGAPYVGRSVRAVIDELRAAGLPLVYSSNLLNDELAVESEPTSIDPLRIAREVLRPHGLEIRESGGALLIVRSEATPAPAATSSASIAVAAPGGGAVEGSVQADPPTGPSAPLVAGGARFDGLAPGRHTFTVRAPGYLPQRAVLNVAAGQAAVATVTLVEAVPKLDEVMVTASRYDLLKEIQPSSAFFSREQIENLSDLGDDTLRVAHRLPGIATNEFSARSHVRGGAMDESTVVFDGVKLVEPFHLRDYQSVFSAVDQRIVSGTQIYSGGFPAAYGDALSGLTVIEQREPTDLHHEIGLSLFYTSLLSSGTFNDGRAQWLVSGRQGNVDRLLNEDLGEPSYADAFVHVATALGAKHRLAFNAIAFDDDILFKQGGGPGSREEGRSETDSNQMWLKLDSDWTETLSSRTIFHSTRFEAQRQGVVDETAELLAVADDRRELDSTGFKQDWEWQGPGRQWLTFGLEIDELDGSYHYSSIASQRGVLASLGTVEPVRDAALAPFGNSYGAYVSDRVRITDRLIADLGVRWDRQTYLPPSDDEQFSPRASVLYRFGANTDLRASYGRFFQAEGLLDLQIEDGVLEFAAAQDASHSIVGVDHRFGGDLSLRVEWFRKWTRRARPRYENLFAPLDGLPELRPGRVQVSPDHAEATGLEVLVAGERPFSWWAGYTLASVDDLIGSERVPRAWDQRHAVTAGATWEVGRWSLSSALAMHTGWPATAVSVETVQSGSGSPTNIAVAGPRNAERLDSLRRIDLRASRVYDVGVGSLRFFTEVTNLTNRDNPCCLDYDPVTLPDGSQTLARVERNGMPFTTNVGVLWEF